MSSLCEVIDIPVITDSRGSLSFIENGDACPFTIQRAYWLFDSNDQMSRGHHAHKKLKQIILCINGSVKLRLDNGSSQEEIELSSPSKAVLLEGFLWRELYDFKGNPVVLVLCSSPYTEEDYVREYDEFKRIASSLS